MSTIEIHNQCPDYQTYRSQRVKSLFNVDSGANFDRVFPMREAEDEWTVGVVVGPSGSGKTSAGHALAELGFSFWEPEWLGDQPIVEAIAPGQEFDVVTGALATVGLGDVPSWLRPYSVLSNGERFRASLARAIVDAPDRIVIDEFTSVVDRQIAKIGAMAFAKGWRRSHPGGQVVVLTCHYDILEWMDPDWILDTATGEWDWARGRLHRPPIDVEVVETGWSYWSHFKPHHYLADAGPMAFATAYVGFVGGEPVCHLGMSGKVAGKRREARACRMVVTPEWQGAGIGMRFLNRMCQRELDGGGFIGSPTTTQFHTAHPALVAALKRDPKWHQMSQKMHGSNKAASVRSTIRASGGRVKAGWGGHFRGVTGWRYHG